MQLIIVYDPDKEIACAVDSDTRIGFGPAMIGPGAGDVLEAFFSTIPYDVSEASNMMLRDWFEQFLENLPATATPTTAEGDTDTLEQDGHPAVGAEESLAEQEARQHTDTPAEQPSDTDMGADESEAAYVGPCWACDAKGVVPAGPGQTVVCTVCEGTRELPVVHA